MAGADKSIYQRQAEQRRRSEGGTGGVAAEKGDEQSQRDREKHTGFTAAKAGAGSGGGSDMPKQGSGESAGAYAGRLRAWRERKRAALK